MEKSVLVDTNIYIHLMRRRLHPVETLRNWAAHEPAGLATCGMVRMEVLRGFRSVLEKQRMNSFFDILSNVPTTNTIWEEAAEIAWQLDRQGEVIPATDILIAVSARRAGAAVMTGDAHFNRIPGLTIIPNPFN